MDTEFNKWLQSRLTSHGFPVGMIDGNVGAVTTRAVQAFQASRSLPVTGTANSATVEALRATTVGSIPRPTGAPIALGTVGNQWPTQSQVPTFYGEVGANQTQIEIPFDMWLAWDRGQRVRKMTLHTKVAASALRVLQNTAGLYSVDDRRALGLDIFGGSLNVRKMRGGTSWSMHSWGIALDFDPERNGLNTKAPQARLSHDDAVPFWKAWEAEGWLSLGRARNYDWMHVQAARI